MAADAQGLVTASTAAWQAASPEARELLRNRLDVGFAAGLDELQYFNVTFREFLRFIIFVH